MGNEAAPYEIVHNEEQSQWEARLTDGTQIIGYMTYEIHDAKIYFTHTVVKGSFRGQGIASELVEAAFEFEKTLGENEIVAVCPFVKKYVAEHPEYLS
ncbi:GNAT family N-acetyltransferase [Arcanobacterium ihumii]|uniref:GNAT family N-acetyltransferase n=1 Tax=Arcanobacterium ihumii TaxID=2138162 RepID=UPI000F53350A|nr:GNAT family N-acetyltransferase [Arcanobacterium ihumii]